MTPNPPSGSASAIALAGLLALAVGMGIGRFAFTPILPMMHEDAGVSIARADGSRRRTTSATCWAPCP
jgi:Uncharacterised MFS-type transporter YbfB